MKNSTLVPIASRKPLGMRNLIGRFVFRVIWMAVCRWTPAHFHAWRCVVLRIFGAKLALSAHIYPSVRIWAPWNLRIEVGACLAPGVDCYNVDVVSLGPGAIVSQRAFLCTASHDFNSREFALVTAPINVERGAWVCAEAYVGPGVSVGEGAVVAARAVVTRDVEACAIVAGNPARLIGTRKWREPPDSFGQS